MQDNTNPHRSENPSAPAYLLTASALRAAADRAIEAKLLLRRVAADTLDRRQIQLLRDLDEIISHVEASIAHLAISRETFFEVEPAELERTAA